MSLKAYSYLILVSLVGIFFFVDKLLNSNLDFDKYAIALIVLIVFSFLAEIYELEIFPRWNMTTGIAMTMASIFIGGTNLAVWVLLFSTLPAEIITRWDKLKISFSEFLIFVAFNFGQLALSVVAASFVFEYFGSPKPPYESIGVFSILLITFLTYEVVNTFLVSGAVALSTNQRFRYIVRFSLKNVHIHFLTLGIISILISIIYFSSPWQLIFTFLPLALVHFSMRNYLRLRHNSHAAFSHIAKLLAKRDEYTGMHSDEVATWSVMLAKAMHLPEEMIENIRMGATIHDIGKIAVPDAILNKTDILNEQEWQIMKTHPEVGEEIIKDLEIYRDVAPIVRHEHEHWNGNGYPDGLEGEQIPLGARIVAVADVFSALTTERNYRPAQWKPLKYSREEAVEVMKEMSGNVLDPHLVTVFVKEVLSKPDL